MVLPEYDRTLLEPPNYQRCWSLALVFVQVPSTGRNALGVEGVIKIVTNFYGLGGATSMLRIKTEIHLLSIKCPFPVKVQNKAFSKGEILPSAHETVTCSVL